MKTHEVIKDLGGPAKVAKQIRSPKKRGRFLTTAAVSMWKRIPAEHVQTIVKMSGGRFTAEQLRPDIFGKAA